MPTNCDRCGHPWSEHYDDGEGGKRGCHHPKGDPRFPDAICWCPALAAEAEEPIRHVTARTCPIDPETGEFQSRVAEAAFVEAQRYGINDRKVMQQILQAHNAAEDRSRAEYDAYCEREREAKYGICPTCKHRTINLSSSPIT